ncbi:MAG: C25 family cysteine peptidase, partial [Bacteroidales bacterium]
MKKIYLNSVMVLIACIFTAHLHAQTFSFSQTSTDGFVLKSQTQSSVVVTWGAGTFQLADQEIDGNIMKQILMPGSLLPNNEGAPNLPGFGRYIAIPEGAAAKLNIIGYRTEIIKDVDIAPAPRIPLDTENGPLQYAKNQKIYSDNSFYPAENFLVSAPTEIRGVNAVMLGITPFSYNPVSRELMVYYDIEVEITFEGGTGYFGEERLRSRWFDPVLQDAFLNYQSLPAIDYAQRHRQHNQTDATGYEYLIVVPDDPTWMPYAEQIRDFRTTQGILTGIVTLSDIGGNTPAILENYFNNAYNTWDIPPVAVLLMADYGSSMSNTITSPIWDGYCVSDNIFADVNNNDMPDIIFARMTAQNEPHLQTMVSKMLDYENNPPTDANFYHKPITALGWQTERWFQICSETVGGYWREVQGKSPVRINAIYSGTPGTTWSTATNTSTVVNYFGPNGLGYIPATPAELGGWSGGTAQHVINAINDGAFALQHRDHGGTTGWGEPDFQSTNINSLTNTAGNELVFVFSINCLTGKYDISGECFAEKFHRHTYNGQNAGALGLIAASEVSYSFVNDAYVWGMMDNMNPDFMPDYGPFVVERGFLPAFGNAAGKYFLQQSAWPYNTSNKEVTYHLFHHHGGAFMQVYSEVPQNLSVTHNPILYSGETSFTVSANAGSFIALSVDGEIIGTAEGTGSPVSIAIEPQIPPAEILVTVTKQNYFRYQSVVEVIPPAGPYVVFDSYEINDYTDNNGNGLLDYGETIWLTMTLKNVGVEAANAITASISTGDSYITITDNSSPFGNIPPGGTIAVADAFIFEADQDIPDGHLADFTLIAQNNLKTQWTSYFNIPAHAPAIVLEGYYVDDSGGNNNGILDPGETAIAVISLINNGGADAYNVTGALSDSDPYLQVITTDPQPFGNLTAGASASASFTVSADAGTPGGYIAEAIMNITAGPGIEQQASIEFSFEDYCMPSADCSFGDGFTGFALESISNLNNGCSPSGYGDFTAMTTDLEPGQTYTVQWSTGYSNQDACLWIDLDNDRQFEENERLITDFNLASVGTLYSTTFTVPDVVYPGNKRLRIRAHWQNSAADPCANFSYGETEDYSVYIGTYLAPPLSLLATVMDHDVELNWTAPPADILLGYNVYRDGSLIAEEVMPTTWLDAGLQAGTYSYTVTAVYDGGQSAAAGPVTVP